MNNYTNLVEMISQDLDASKRSEIIQRNLPFKYIENSVELIIDKSATQNIRSCLQGSSSKKCITTKNKESDKHITWNM